MNYTSGSTGQPKGVVSTNAGIAALTATLVDGLGLRSGDRVLQISPPNFDIWVGADSTAQLHDEFQLTK